MSATTAEIDFDHKAPGFAADPFPILLRLQEDDPVHWAPRLKGWVLTRHDDVRMALGWSVNRIDPFLKQKYSADEVRNTETLKSISKWTAFNDAPVHTRLRAVMSNALTPAYIAATEPLMREIINDVVDDIVERESFNAMHDFSHLIPSAVMAALMGLPRSDCPQLCRWADELNLFVGGAKIASEKYIRSALGVTAMTEYFEAVVDSKIKSPKEDLISRLVVMRDDNGDGMTRDELIANCVMLTQAGYVTTAHLLGNGILALLSNPEQLSLLHETPSLLPQAVEELLRYDGPVQAMVRIADEDIDLHGQRISKGNRVFAMVNAANRDPRRFGDPNKLDFSRKDNKHIVFGHGPHTCIGLRLARLEIPIAFEVLLKRIKHMELSGQVEWIDSLAFRGPASFSVSMIQSK